jgi:ATP phosphoribosyltransferase regulatory subunit
MGDLLPPEASLRRALTARILRTFELAGYELVLPPLFEHAEVVARGTDGLDARDLLRFVEPESGEVAVLPPDVTPQVARIVATRLAARPRPLRLCYEARVFRRTRGRARRHRQLSQAGVECVGLPGPEGDAEVIALAARACGDAGLRDYRIELGELTLVASVLASLPPGARPLVSETLARKDPTALSTLLAARGASRDASRRVLALLDHAGDASVLERAASAFTRKPERAALDNLRAVTERLARAGLGPRVAFDLGEPRGLSYYTGVRFAVLAPGPGEEVGGGGRYDNLLSRYGAPAPATGFALDLHHLQWSLAVGGRPNGHARPTRVVVAGPDGNLARDLADKLRATGVAAATLTGSGRRAALAYARAWGYDGILMSARGSLRLLRVSDGRGRLLRGLDARSIASHLGTTGTEARRGV